MISTNEFKNGMHIALDGTVYRIVEFQHVKPGKGGAFIQVEMRDLKSGNKTNERWRTADTVERLMTEEKEYTYSYTEGSNLVLMDAETFEQIHLPITSLSDELRFMRENDTVQLLMVDGKPSSIQLPAAVELEVTETEPGVKGDTVSNVTKPATLETGAVVQVPLFVEPGERIRVDTREARYISRA